MSNEHWTMLIEHATFHFTLLPWWVPACLHLAALAGTKDPRAASATVTNQPIHSLPVCNRSLPSPSINIHLWSQGDQSHPLSFQKNLVLRPLLPEVGSEQIRCIKDLLVIGLYIEEVPGHWSLGADIDGQRHTWLASNGSIADGNIIYSK